MAAAAVNPVISLENISYFYGSGSLRKQVLYDVSAEILPETLLPSWSRAEYLKVVAMGF